MWRHHVAHVKLSGLVIRIPPHDENNARAVSMENNSSERQGNEDEPKYASRIVIAELEAPEAQLLILRRDPDKGPRTWYLHALKLKQVGVHSAMPFEATLTNAVPPGRIDTKGTFRPWQRRAPGRTPLDGAFVFEHADLSFFKGIGGTLSAKG